MYSVFDVANYILDKNLGNMTHKKLQKLCYYVQAWGLALQDKKLMSTKFEAWVHGPVSKDLYDVRKKGEEALREKGSAENIDAEDKIFIDNILKLYGQYNGTQLETLTHAEDPWKDARGDLSFWDSSNSVIEEDSMQSFYVKMLPVV